MPTPPRSLVSKTGKAIARRARALVDGRADLVIAADLLAVPAEEERGVVEVPVGLDAVVAADDVHAVSGGRSAEPRRASARPRAGRSSPGSASLPASQLPRPSVSSGNAMASQPPLGRLLQQGLQLGEGLIHARQDVIDVLHVPVDQPRLRLRGGDANGARRGRGPGRRHGWRFSAERRGGTPQREAGG